jgi:hypothetical protein
MPYPSARESRSSKIEFACVFVCVRSRKAEEKRVNSFAGEDVDT